MCLWPSSSLHQHTWLLLLLPLWCVCHTPFRAECRCSAPPAGSAGPSCSVLPPAAAWSACVPWPPRHTTLGQSPRRCSLTWRLAATRQVCVAVSAISPRTLHTSLCQPGLQTVPACGCQQQQGGDPAAVIKTCVLCVRTPWHCRRTCRDRAVW